MKLNGFDYNEGCSENYAVESIGALSYPSSLSFTLTLLLFLNLLTKVKTFSRFFIKF